MCIYYIHKNIYVTLHINVLCSYRNKTINHHKSVNGVHLTDISMYMMYFCGIVWQNMGYVMIYIETCDRLVGSTQKGLNECDTPDQKHDGG